MGRGHFWKTLQRHANQFTASQGGRETPRRVIASRSPTRDYVTSSSNGVPAYWGNSPGMFPPGAISQDQIYVETRSDQGGLSYQDAVSFYPQVKDAYRDSRTRGKGQTLEIQDSGSPTYVDLVIEDGFLVLKYCRVNSSDGTPRYGKPRDIGEIVGYQPPLPKTITLRDRSSLSKR